jgi:copper(I)-binding protein
MTKGRGACTMGSLVLAVALQPMLSARDQGDVEITRAWVREAAAGQSSTAAYFVVENRSASPVAIVGVSSPVASIGELHNMTMTAARGPMPNGPMGSMMRMVQVDRVVVPAHGTVELKPGGYHVMLFKVARALAVGDTVELTVHLEGGGTRIVTAVVGSRAAVTAPRP